MLRSTLEERPQGYAAVAQKYVSKPLLVRGYKFDLRLYVVLTSLQPLKAFLLEEGLVRFCTEEYQQPEPENMSNRLMHLTNFRCNLALSLDPGHGPEPGPWPWPWAH